MLSHPSSRKIWLFSLLTFGFYFYYWCSHSRDDINKAARQNLVPSCWYFAVPGLNYYWMWLYAGALQQVSFRRIKATDVFLVYLLTSSLVALPWQIIRVLNFTSSPNPSSTHPSLHALLVIVGIVVVAAIVINASGSAFFCSFAQRKINALPHAEPA